MYRVCCVLSATRTDATSEMLRERRWKTLRGARSALRREVQDTIDRGLLTGNSHMDPPLVLAMLPHQAKVARVGQKIIVHDYNDGNHWEHWIEEVE